MVKFFKPPNQQSYGPQFKGARSEIYEGPASLYVEDVKRNSRIVPCVWSFDTRGYQYSRSFYRGVTLKGTKSFTIDLVLDGALAEYVAYFMTGTWALVSVATDKFVVQATLEVKVLSP